MFLYALEELNQLISSHRLNLFVGRLRVGSAKDRRIPEIAAKLRIGTRQILDAKIRFVTAYVSQQLRASYYVQTSIRKAARYSKRSIFNRSIIRSLNVFSTDLRRVDFTLRFVAFCLLFRKRVSQYTPRRHCL